MDRSSACWLLIVVLAGCGGDGLKLAPVEGIVTLNGQPVADAGVVFSPVSPEQGPPASGGTNKDGRFTLITNNRDGAAIGDHQVSISKADPFGDEVSTEELEMADVVRSRGLKVFKTKHFLPEHYSNITTSKLTATVEKKNNFIEFKLVQP